jgi:hypothetical protein
MANAQITRFKGLNNVSDGLRLSDGWLTTADNINITDTGAIVRRDGYTLALSGSYTGAYTTKDFTRMYVIDSGSLKKINADMTSVTLRSGITASPMYFAEVNQQVFYTNGVDSGIILIDDSVIDWYISVPPSPVLTAIGGSLDAGTYQVVCTYETVDGRESGSSDPAEITLDGTQQIHISNILPSAGRTCVYIAPANSTVYQLAFITKNTTQLWGSPPVALGRELLNHTLDPLPLGAIVPTFWKGRMYLAEYLPSENASVVWYSLPFGFHLFDPSKDFFLVPGKCLTLCPTKETLVVGTDVQIFSYTGEALVTETNYGVVPGWPWAADENDDKWLWTTHGVCSALPFSNLTLNQISVQSGVKVGAAIIQKSGIKQFVAALHRGGVAFNSRA